MQSQRDGSFEHPKHMFKLISKEINAILGAQTILIFVLFVLFSSLHPINNLSVKQGRVLLG